MRLLIVLLFILASVKPVVSQKIIGEANVPKVEVDGFYRIFISPELSPYLNNEFTTLRIIDKLNKEVPYLFQKEIPTLYTQHFKEYQIVEKKQEKKCCTSLTLKNPDNQPINNISLSIKNAEVTKHATLLGSDDKQNWFALKQHFILDAIDNLNQTTEVKIIDFPLSNYNYYLLQIEDSTSAPLNILRAGYYEINSEEGKYTEVSSFKKLMFDSAEQKKSFITITFDTIQVIDRISLSLTGAQYYLRKASLYVSRVRQSKKGATEHYYELLSEIELSSKQKSIIDLSGIMANQFLIVIENEDNPSLEIAELKTYQLNRYLTAWLKQHDHYKLSIGNADLLEPTYDLAFFKDNIPYQPSVLAIGAITIFQKVKPQLSTTFFTNQSIIWIAIIIVIIILGIMSVKLIKEASMAKKE